MLAVSAGLVFASCSSASCNPVSTVNGYIMAARAGNVASMCSYTITDEQGACVMMYSTMFQIAGAAQALSLQSGSPSWTKEMKAELEASVRWMRTGNFAVSGNKAIVSLVNKCTANSSDCTPNTNPNAGLPTSSLSFSQAFANATSSSASGNAVGLVLINGKWRIEYNSY